MRVQRVLVALVAAFIFILWSTTLHAESHFSAFGTIGYSRTNTSSATYRLTPGYQFGVSDNWTSVLDNRLGAQINYNLTADIEFVSQLLVQRNSNDDLEWTTPWLYMRWQLAPEYEIIAGRFRHSLFMITQEMDVGYASPWVRPPVDFYSLVGESSVVDGVRLKYINTLGQFTATLEGHYGRFSLDRKPRLYIKNPQHYGLSFNVSDGQLTARMSLVQANTEIDAPALSSILQRIEAQSVIVAGDYSIRDIDAQTYANIGLRYEDGDWLFLAETARLWLKTKTFPDKVGHYLTLGHTFGDFTPYMIYSKHHLVNFSPENRLEGTVLSAVRALESRNMTSQQTFSTGVRWDFYSGFALKIQFDNILQPKESVGIQRKPLPHGTHHYYVTNITLDWVF